MESSKETGCRAPEGPILCINNCGFFGSAATMNMCSKCHKDMILKREHEKLAAASIEKVVNGSSNSDETELVLTGATNVQAISAELKVASADSTSQISELKPKESPKKCTACSKRVGLTGFSCKCGNLFCAVHRYSDKHDCPFDYRSAGQHAIAKANPIVVAEKLNKI